jgi:hypothetical protein
VWWSANNKVKHGRDTNFGSASLENVIDAVGALLLANICSHVIIKGESRLVPRRDTRLFTPGRGWVAVIGPVYGRCYAIPGQQVPSSPKSARPPPTDGLGVYVVGKTSGDTGQIALNLRIDNKVAESVDVSTFTLRYWYQDEGLGTALVLSTDYVSIGYSNQGRVTAGRAVAAPSPGPGADHYLELSFTGMLAAQGDKAHQDQFNIHVRLHTANYKGAVDVTNDYSYNGGAIGYNDKITLHDKSGKVIWGAAPC